MKPSDPAPRSSVGGPAQPGGRRRPFRRPAGGVLRPALAVSLGLALLLTACSSPAPSPGGPDAEPSSTTTAGVGASVKPNPAEQARQKVQASLEKSLQGVSKPATDAVRKAMQNAVGPGVAVEVSNSVTPTGLAADAVVAAAVVAPKNCVFVYLRDGAVSTRLLPTLSSGKCFVGDQGGPRAGS